MSDLISRQAVLKVLPHALWGNDWDEALAKAIIESIPTIDPVKHGKWIPFEFGDETWHKCTACGVADQYGTKHISHIPGKFYIVYAIRNYCPNCGASMEG